MRKLAEVQREVHRVRRKERLVEALWVEARAGLVVAVLGGGRRRKLARERLELGDEVERVAGEGDEGDVLAVLGEVLGRGERDGFGGEGRRDGEVAEGREAEAGEGRVEGGDCEHDERSQLECPGSRTGREERSTHC